jgi:hypothetical protein
VKLILLVVALLGSLGMTWLATPAQSQSERKDVAVLVAQLKEKRALVDLNNQWSLGLLLNDVPLLQGLMADNWTTTGTGSGGHGLGEVVETKKHYLALVKSGERSYESITDEETSVWIRGDSAIVTGQTMSTGYLRDVLIAGRSKFIRTYAKQDGRWRMVSANSTLIVPS